jgi:hypothetical protein
MSGLAHGAAKISQIARLYLSLVGAVSLMTTVVPLNIVGAFSICTQ